MAHKRGTVVFPSEDNPLWYKDAIIYELHVRAFSDSDGNGIGDFRGLTEKLDYLRDLGITAIWLLPFSPSPLRDDGYDTADYTDVHPSYGTLKDFKEFLRESHRRGLRVITELVVNHTSDQHPWFQRARHAPPGSKWRNFYVWSDNPEKYKETRIIFKDFESSNWAWDPIAKSYYWHRFYAHQPDLNFDSPHVQKAVLQLMDFWFDMGVDGLRLDAVPYLYEREGTNCENLPETHHFLKQLRRHIDRKFQDRMLLAEANQWPEDAVTYFGDGDECHMNFHFPVMPRLFMSIRMEDRFPIVDIMRQTPTIPETCQWALFLRNHDELTLEMVTDEDRDYMFRVYAQDTRARINLGIRRRLAPLLNNNRRRIELMNGLLFSLPGTPVIYYGDEIGMGDNIYLGDRNGVRTPMQWSADRNAGFSRANPQQLYLPIIIDPEYHYESINVEAQQKNNQSLFWWMKRLITLRKRFKAFGYGTLEFLHPENRKVLAFIRRYEHEALLVVANLSRFVQCAELDLSAYKGMIPTEMFGRTPFPVIGDSPYFMTVGPHSFYWFSLEPQPIAEILEAESPVPVLSLANGSWDSLVQSGEKIKLERILPTYIRSRRWFGGKARVIQSATVTEVISLTNGNGAPSRLATGSCIALIQIMYTEGDPQMYALPLTFAEGEQALRVRDETPQQLIVAQFYRRDTNTEGILYDATWDKHFATLSLESIARHRHMRGLHGEVITLTTRVFRKMLGSTKIADFSSSVLRGEQSNSSIVYGDQFILKIFRRLEAGTHPDLEIGRLLTEKKAFLHTPPIAGFLEYRPAQGEPMILGILQGFVANEGDAWRYTIDMLRHYFERIQTLQDELRDIPLPAQPLLDLMELTPPAPAQEMIGPYLESARLLGQRTGELHLTLASATDERDFSPEPFTTMYQRSLYQSMRTQAMQTLQTLRRLLGTLPEAVQHEAQRVLEREEEILDRLRLLIELKISSLRIRCHGDYHLGQVLYTGNDFVIIDFEGEPTRSISERRRKRSPLLDLAGMLRSFHYAPYTVLLNEVSAGVFRPENLSQIEPWARCWYLWVSACFLKSYLDTVGHASFIPQQREELQTLLTIYLLDKAIYEVNYELNNRPSWVRIPLWGILQLLLPTSGERLLAL